MGYDRNGNWVGGGTPSDTELGVSDFDQGSADAPIWGWLSGATNRRDTARRRSEADTNRGYWDSLNPPSEADFSGSPESRAAQSAALQQLGQWGRGGLTQADQQMMASQRTRAAQQAESQRAALSQGAYARGMGGSGADLALQQSANQGTQQQASDAESQMLQSAQMRALAATQAQAQLGGQMRQQDQSATQAAWGAQTDRAAGATGQYGTDVGSSRFSQQQQQQGDQGLMSLIGTILAA